ncbi:endonuclease/exonuclease/phosphatase family protein [Vibrio sp.]|nr:endonuclease/exonuclease/phosphatase family protein [Vibrio sp.]
MNTNRKLTFATANLFNFIEPPGAYYDFENIYEAEDWKGKCHWTKEQFRILDADIIGVQEVFSIDAAKQLFSELGYPYFACVDEPHIEDEYIYSRPVVALASRYPIALAQSVTLDREIEQLYQTSVPDFSRKPIYARIGVPEIGDIAVYVCHLKSQRSAESVDESREEQVIGKWLSSQQRGWETVMLRLFMEQQYASHPVPTVLMGDMNQSLTSDITGLLTKEFTQNETVLSLRDSWDIYNKRYPDLARVPTHYHFAKGNVLDYILVSQEFQADSSCSLADLVDHRVLDPHLINPIFERDKQASDHAFVALTVEFIL